MERNTESGIVHAKIVENAATSAPPNLRPELSRTYKGNIVITKDQGRYGFLVNCPFLTMHRKSAKSTPNEMDALDLGTRIPITPPIDRPIDTTTKPRNPKTEIGGPKYGSSNP